MRPKLPLPTFCVAISLGGIAYGQSTRTLAASASSHIPTYTVDGKMNPPLDYREWVFLSSGLDMSYSPRLKSMPDHSMFDNVFVNPEAYVAFKATGHWPDKTIMVLEFRAAESTGSINKAGHFQGKMTGAEVHVRDAARGEWAFYSFDGPGPGKLLPKEAACYSCHRDHGAVDTTFIQFYPTLLPIANQKRTLSAEYVNQEGAHSQK